MKTGKILGLALALSLLAPAVHAEPAFRTFLSQSVSNFDPLYMSSRDSREISSLIHQGLVAYSPTILPPRAGAYNQVIPALAESWQVAPDKKTYIFKLHPEARFHNGRVITAADVKYSFERACNPLMGSSNYWAVERLNIKGLKRYQAARRAGVRNPHLLGVEVIDHHIVQLHLEEPIPMALDLLTLPNFSIVPAEDVERWWKDYRSHPVGAGPYQLESVSEDQTLHLKRFEGYYESQAAPIQALQFQIMPETKERFQAFVKKQVDHAPLPTEYFQRVLEDPVWNPMGGEKIVKASSQSSLQQSKVLKIPRWTTHYLSMDNQSFPFNEVKVRQAFNYAVDKQAITDHLLQTYARPVSGVFPPSFPGGRLKEPLFRQDISRAKNLLFEAGWRDKNGDGFVEPWQNPHLDLTLYYQNNDDSYTICRRVQEDLATVGVKIHLEPLASLASSGFAVAPIFYHAAWTPTLADASEVFYPTFHSSQAGRTNTARYSNPRVDQLVQMAEDLYYEPKRYELYAEAERLILEDAPWLFLYHPVDYLMVQPSVSRYLAHPMLPSPYQVFELGAQTASSQ
ncbi:hypothetical protein COW36_11855 [bacterium (Candidatus Blackallbacteria) CG17_big_fil_post_rev_8_21_14_2_50_48_46]|uniref:Solute-binding protein family 5 domain-containing protein n=1 Tax=bacterium (Candidatus Blackallbacteria) CG17_big_fil_post_rev_8_21_14_2_50_48_46 TaxID=2014261 RepID=A0A2M7G3K3_9BACT|nr:MAG: hypothetical protein COW64_03405 [bacterium (Candidatus Blackallbacteria) CG18_big_fil_WC_8_21_14_2_50_49_26]PIW16458.1 MAG: hypothetical protein COW36_11855 [bacterium (Candidatus Blackallbacteria) CG17_big_fil_post_rev_8_21_14_2_50_48_46]PIW45966.1 MAG: hypothetical protein COW20_17120 [bacterium (Candidatus Blackallbacteria) CG13_big_fil_rev_8_21_14_2_50_49_14]